MEYGNPAWAFDVYDEVVVWKVWVSLPRSYLSLLTKEKKSEREKKGERFFRNVGGVIGAENHVGGRKTILTL